MSKTKGCEFETRTAAIAAHIDPSINVITTAGHTTLGDGGGATYKRITPPSCPARSFKGLSVQERKN